MLRNRRYLCNRVAHKPKGSKFEWKILYRGKVAGDLVICEVSMTLESELTGSRGTRNSHSLQVDHVLYYICGIWSI
jgi:hypothetical protein